ncbi:amino acid ABC transporter permease [Clostridium folliculivorans]|uniref:Glutamine ABC transporter permease n=1 Tax=Clostridium folliculivorans TaxID=2886038 RepID=A0A9W5Y442_9CLOT|nr:amino acid ABC transporter permease [Clostridium folliculivorans]GKU26200.1 glutamine ABC transporter permease [Clostridium folliculivorans]GKU31872.1 glutamine ABC transporter permease [Clostridium folliculivorans]
MKVEIISTYLPILLEGCLRTIELTVISILCGLLLAFIVVLMKLSKNKILKSIGTFYTWFFRGIPLMILLFIIYFGLPEVNITLTSFEAAILGLSINISAYVAEAIRGAMLSVNKNQWEAAQTEGLNFIQTVFYIILPQSLGRMLPAVANEFIALLKDTALVSTIAMTDLMNNAQHMANVSFRPLEIFFMASVMYLIMTTFFTTGFKFVEKKFALADL